MFILQVLCLLILLVVCVFAPGFFVVRKLRWGPVEKLCGSIGLSLLSIYIVSFLAYLMVPDRQKYVHLAYSIFCLILVYFSRNDILKWIQIGVIRKVLKGQAFCTAWMLLILSAIRHYSGAFWCIDWLEHFDRSLYFLHHFPVEGPLYGYCLLPARPPMMNLIAAFFMSQVGDQFEFFQVIFVFLNALMFSAGVLIMRAWSISSKKSVTFFSILFCLSPVMVQECTYTWTKALTAFYVVLAISFYLSGWKKKDFTRMNVAFLALSAGILVHYSAGPYAVFLMFHYLLVVVRSREDRWKETAALFTANTLVLLTWFGWAIWQFGLKTTFASNTSITLSQQYQGNTIVKIFLNLLDSIVPVVVRDRFSVYDFPQADILGMLRDNVFDLYQLNIPFSMGLLAVPCIIALVLRQLYRGGGKGNTFWRWMVPMCIVLGIAVCGERGEYGLAHLTLLAMTLLGLTFLSTQVRLNKYIYLLLLTGAILDSTLGILLHVRFESMENRPERVVFGEIESTPVGPLVLSGPYSLSMIAWNNWFEKHQYTLSTEWLARLEHQSYNVPEYQKRLETTRNMLRVRQLEDDSIWHGWFKKHGGSLTFLGDRLGSTEWAGLSVQIWLMTILMTGMIWEMYLLFQSELEKQ